MYIFFFVICWSYGGIILHWFCNHFTLKVHVLILNCAGDLFFCCSFNYMSCTTILTCSGLDLTVIPPYSCIMFASYSVTVYFKQIPSFVLEEPPLRNVAAVADLFCIFYWITCSFVFLLFCFSVDWTVLWFFIRCVLFIWVLPEIHYLLGFFHNLC